MPVSFEIKNIGDATATLSDYIIYLSDDDQLDPTVDHRRITSYRTTDLAPGESLPSSHNVQIFWPHSAGLTYLLVKTDHQEQLDEHEEENNLSATAFNVDVPPYPDLGVWNTQMTKDEFTISQLNFEIRNLGYVDAPFINFRSWLSHDRDLSADDIEVTTCDHAQPLAARTNRWCNTSPNFHFPVGYSGRVYVITKLDYNDEITELPGKEENIHTWGIFAGGTRTKRLECFRQ